MNKPNHVFDSLAYSMHDPKDRSLTNTIRWSRPVPSGFWPSEPNWLERLVLKIVQERKHVEPPVTFYVKRLFGRTFVIAYEIAEVSNEKGQP